MRRFVLAAVAVSLLAACGGGDTTPEPERITGTLTVGISGDQTVMMTWSEQAKTCTGADVAKGFAGIGPVADVTVRDESGDIIATGSVGQGERTIKGCVFPINVADVPEAKFYEVEVGRRGGIRLSRAELEEQNFEVDLSLSS